MIKRFFYTFFGILGLFVIYAAIALPFILIRGALGEDTFGIIMMTWGAFVMLSFVPFFLLIFKMCWRFPHDPNSGPPATMDAMKKEILDINKYDVPVMVEEKKKRSGKPGDKVFKTHLTLTWKYVDAKWWELLAKAGLQMTYQLHVKLDDQKKKATLIDVRKTVDWSAGPTHVHIGLSSTRGVILAKGFGKQWGIKENFSLGKIYDYKFDPSEIKTPVMNTLLRRGWDVEFGLF